MPDPFQYSDDLGPFKIIHIYEPSLQLKGILVVDNVAAGPSIGGLRMASNVTTEECFRLARAMTLKNAAAGLPHGGGKSVLVGDPGMPEEQKEALIRAFACALRNTEEYIVGPDMGTNETCMAWVHDEIGRAVGLPRELGGIPLDEIGATGWGLFHAAEAAMDFCDFQLEGARVIVQGFGAVGKHAARFLTEKGAVLVGASDSQSAIINQTGLNVNELIKYKTETGKLTDFPQGKNAERDAIMKEECEIWIPAARPDVIHQGNVAQLNTKLVLQGANIAFTEGAEDYLHNKGVVVVPDFIANAGGVICAAMEYQGSTQNAAMDTIAEKIAANTETVLSQSKKQAISPRQAALNIAKQRVQNAMGYRRF